MIAIDCQDCCPIREHSEQLPFLKYSQVHFWSNPGELSAYMDSSLSVTYRYTHMTLLGQQDSLLPAWGGA